MRKLKVRKMSNPLNLTNELYLELTKNEKIDTECIHVTDLLKDQYSENTDMSVFIRGKLYHYAIENLLNQMHIKGKLTVFEMERSRKIEYTVKDKKFNLCFTPDAILMINKKVVLTEIKSTIKSRDYAILQTSIYKYLLENFSSFKKIDECMLITGDLQTYKLHCDSETGKQILEDRLGNSLLLFM